MSATLLIADDDLTIRTVLGKALSRHGYRVRTTAHAATLWHWASQGEGDLIITDVMMPDGDGLELVPSLQRLRPELKIIVISAQNSLSTSAKANELGVFGYLPKPFDLKELAKLVDLALKNNATNETSEQKQHTHDFPLVGNSTLVRSLFRQMGKYAVDTSPVLITGGAGSGKSLAASSFALNKPDDEVLIVENLDKLDAEQQIALLPKIDEALKNGVKIVSTSSPKIFQMKGAGSFEQGLFDRLSTLQLKIPDLEQRKGDIPLLVEHFQKQNGSKQLYSPEVIEFLKQQKWPGNVRQLKNLVRQISVDSDQNELNLDVVETAFGVSREEIRANPCFDIQDMNSFIIAWVKQQITNVDGGSDLHSQLVQKVEKPLIENVLVRTRNNQIKTSEILGINRNTLRKKIRELKIDKPK